ncbi:serine/arginine repetitive matrix protein 2 [Ceratina calcarata]|uniref:Serine/arginine repetitive matrix protein 2 n=1 Tax=Ceratina calcarata TaxID=156304 RepID=A0AAJ7W963_9HYME|nr:serine/arginine repetitive matrix protein 2 [Ceratina calcarata]XP_026667810.1 serine/arginine repetitive matrix protein 2 [Ceratina calcarata]XP_026667813.1 serine/arginine repetitive matrix protein 2 [Ceratina calcarata]XP_026667819.1 serine/arginine repetitive matrix protein 2 [Ceratina calcarata]
MMEVISTRRYEARPPPTSHPPILIDPENSVALIKEEEWETRKKKEITTTRQIETRVKRQVVLEDGEVVVDSGPLVTTNTTEDVEQQEHTTQERRTTGDQPQQVEWPTGGKSPVDSGSVVQKELNETVVRSREEIEERLETEDRQQLGDISDEAYQTAVRNNRGDLRVALAESAKQLASQTGPRVVQHTTKSNKVIDTEKTLERKELKPDGLIVTERKRTVEHEEIKDDEVPDDGKDVNGDDASEKRKESSQRFVKKRDEDVVDYVSGGERVAREMRYVAETTEGERIGDWTPSPTAMRTTRFHKHSGFPESFPARKDVLTKKPLDFEEEDEARKFETSKWLESHFGSESRSSHGSIDADDSPLPTSTNTSYINVTMKSCGPRERDYQNTNSNRQRRNTGRDSTSPSGYFHGISEWSERYQGREKQNHVGRSSPLQYVEAVHTNGYGQEHPRNHVEYSKTYESVLRREHQESFERRTPSPPVRRRSKEQWTRSEEKTSLNDSAPARTASPVHVVQRTWESRNQEQTVAERDNRKKSTSRSRSTSPVRESHSRISKKSAETSSSTPSRPPKGSGHSKYKIGESFRKLVEKLRSASSERKNKRASSSSTSQLTQTDDNGPTYMQYNVIDKNIPLDLEEKPPERPPRSPRNSAMNNTSKTTKTIKPEHTVQEQRTESTPPLHRYYLGEDPFGGSIYGREKGYQDSRRSGKLRRNVAETEYSVASSSLGRLSKSTSRLANNHEREEQLRSAQTLPRNLHSGGQYPRSKRQQPVSKLATSSTPSSTSQSRQYGSMINISIKNTVTSPKVMKDNIQPPIKPERTYKSSLLRSKSFNVEAGTPPRIPYTSNSQLNRLDETPPLKSPGILASISRSNRDLFKDY